MEIFALIVGMEVLKVSRICEYCECPLCGRGGWTDERAKTELGYVCSSCVLKQKKEKAFGGW